MKIATNVAKIVTIWVAVCLLVFGLGVATRFLVEDAAKVVASFIRKVFQYPTSPSPTPRAEREAEPTPATTSNSGPEPTPQTESVPESEPVSEPASVEELASLKVTELRKIARSLNIKGVSHMRKPELVQTLAKALWTKQELELAPEPTPKPESGFTSASVTELRKLARSLKFKGVSRLRKKELIELLTEALSAKPSSAPESTS